MLFSESLFQTESKPNEAALIRKRKKEPLDMEFSRLLRKPRKRNGKGFF